jgi:hypothetical protein
VHLREDQARTWDEVAVVALTHPALQALNAAWERAAAAEGTAPPSRAVFRPTDVVEALGRITVLERVPAEGGAAEGGPGDGKTAYSWRYRLVGTEVVDLVQEDFTGRTIEHFHVGLAGMLRAQFGRAEAAGRPVAFIVRTVVDHRPYAYERLVLPARSAPGAGTDQVVVASMPLDLM